MAELPDDALLEAVQRQTFRFFWEGAHPDCGMARDRIPAGPADRQDLVVTGGSGFGVMAIIVAVERGWVTRDEAIGRLRAMLDLLYRATCYHGVFAHSSTVTTRPRFLSGARTMAPTWSRPRS